MNNLNTNAYIRPLFRWWRLILSAAILALVASAVSTLFQPNLYVSRTTLMIGTTILDPNPDSGQIYVAQQLAEIYSDMAMREPIQQATMEALQINWLPKYASRAIPNTQMIEIAVTDTNPKRAQIIAGELARQLMQASPAMGGTETGTRQEFIAQQLSSLQDQIQATQDKIEELQKSMVGLNSASQIANIESEIANQTQKLNTLRQNYASFLANSQQGALNILTVVEPANLPSNPSGTNRLIIILLAGLVGLSLGAVAAYVLEFLDQTIRTTNDVERIFHLPVIGYISEIGGANGSSNNGANGAYVTKNPNSIIAESFRLLVSNIEFFRITNTLRTILITSPSQGNGKTTVASNLALSISREGHDVILVDADLRRPMIHRSLKLPKSPGLCEVINGKADLESVARCYNGDKSLKVITAGVQPPNITEVVGSTRISSVLASLKDRHEIVILDAPPLIIADSYNLAARADGVIIVLVPGHTSYEQARALKEQLERANAKIVGFVFNKVSQESVHSYGDYQYRSLYLPKYYADYVAKTEKEPVQATGMKKLADFFEYGRVPPEVLEKFKSTKSKLKERPRKPRKADGHGPSEKE